MLVSLNQALHEDRLRVIVLEEFLHLRRQIFGTLTANGVDTHGSRQRDEVGVRHTRVRVPRVVEEV